MLPDWDHGGEDNTNTASKHPANPATPANPANPANPDDTLRHDHTQRSLSQ